MIFCWTFQFFLVLLNLAILKEGQSLEIDYKSIGFKVKKIRREKGLTQEELAEKCNLSSVYIGYVENAKRQIGLSSLAKIAGVLDTGLDYLIGNQNLMNNDELLEDCNELQRRIISSIIISVKDILSENDL